MVSVPFRGRGRRGRRRGPPSSSALEGAELAQGGSVSGTPPSADGSAWEREHPQERDRRAHDHACLDQHGPDHRRLELGEVALGRQRLGRVVVIGGLADRGRDGVGELRVGAGVGLGCGRWSGLSRVAMRSSQSSPPASGGRVSRGGRGGIPGRVRGAGAARGPPRGADRPSCWRSSTLISPWARRRRSSRSS